MLSTNNDKVNDEINVKREEKKYSWLTVFTWLYLKTIGWILPKGWNEWTENILYYDKTTVSNEIQTDVSEITGEDIQVGLKHEENYRRLEKEKSDEASRLLAEIKERDARIKELEDRANEQQQTISKLTDENQNVDETVKQNNRDLQAQVKKLEQDLSTQKDLTDQFQRKSENLEQSLAQAKEEKKMALADIASLERQLKSSQQSKEDLQEQVSLLNAELREARSSAPSEDLIQAEEKENKVIEGIKLHNGQLILDQRKLQKQITDLNRDLKDVLESKQELQNQIDFLNAELEKVRSSAPAKDLTDEAKEFKIINQ